MAAAGEGSALAGKGLDALTDRYAQITEERIARVEARMQQRITDMQTEMQKEVTRMETEMQKEVTRIKADADKTISLTEQRGLIGASWVDEASEILSVASRPHARTGHLKKDGSYDKHDWSLLESFGYGMIFTKIILVGLTDANEITKMEALHTLFKEQFEALTRTTDNLGNLIPVTTPRNTTTTQLGPIDPTTGMGVGQIPQAGNGE